jgi:hydrogenase maturation protease
VILVAGIGNVFLGDDGFGVEVVRRLGGRLPETRVLDFGIRGFDLTLALLEPYDLVILVDTVRRRGSPGTLYLLEVTDDSGPADFSAHGMDPAQVLRNVRAMGGSPGRIRLVGCEPASLAEMGRLSAEVELAVREAVDMIERLVRREAAAHA